MGNGPMALDLILSPHSLLSRNFTKVESSKITALFRAIESLPSLPPLVSACAMPPTERNGAVGVVAQPCSGTTLLAITPYGMLLLSYMGELDAHSVGLLTSFIREHTEGALEVMQDNADDQVARINELEDVQKLCYALHEIAEHGEDAEAVRVAFVALLTTTAGQIYLRENPIRL